MFEKVGQCLTLPVERLKGPLQHSFLGSGCKKSATRQSLSTITAVERIKVPVVVLVAAGENDVMETVVE